MNTLRRVAVAAVMSVWAAGAALAQESLPRITGELNYGNFERVAAYLTKAIDRKVALDVTLPLNNDETDGNMTTFVLDGQFEIAHLKPGAPSVLYVDAGFDLVDDKYYTLKGVFDVQDGGAEAPGTLSLAFVDAPAGATFTDMPIDQLPAGN